MNHKLFLTTLLVLLLWLMSAAGPRVSGPRHAWAASGKKSAAPIEKEKGITVRSGDEIKTERQPFSQTIRETLRWLLGKRVLWFFIGLILVGILILALFRKSVGDYLPKPNFKGNFITRAGAFAVSVYGLAIIGLGIFALLSGVVGVRMDVGSLEALILIAGGGIIFVLGFFVGNGSKAAACIVLFLVAADLGHIFVSMHRNGETLREVMTQKIQVEPEEGTEDPVRTNVRAPRLVFDSLMLIGSIVLILAIKQRWQTIVAEKQRRQLGAVE